MLLLAIAFLIVGYTLVYAGVKGIDWAQPWKLLTLADQSGQPTG